MNYRKLLLDIALVFAISFVTVKVFSPKVPDNTMLWSDTEDKIEMQTLKLQEMERTLLNYNAKLKEIKLQIDDNKTKVVHVRSNRTANNSLVSAMSSDELTQLLAKRYQDSTKVNP